MNLGDLCRQLGVREQVCSREEYVSKTIIQHIKKRKGMSDTV